MGAVLSAIARTFLCSSYHFKISVLRKLVILVVGLIKARDCCSLDYLPSTLLEPSYNVNMNSGEFAGTANSPKLCFIQDCPLSRYVEEHSLRFAPAQKKLYEITKKHARGRMMGSPDSLQLLQLLIRAIGAKNVLDVGVYTGCSALAEALAIPDDGKVVALDVCEEYANIGKPFWEEAGVAHKIDLRIAPAIQTLDELIARGECGRYDFAFIDADKTEYDCYYEKCLQLLRPGGIIAMDNVLWRKGLVADPKANDPETNSIRALNEKVKDDPRVDISMLKIGDGLTIALKR